MSRDAETTTFVQPTNAPVGVTQAPISLDSVGSERFASLQSKHSEIPEYFLAAAVASGLLDERRYSESMVIQHARVLTSVDQILRSEKVEPLVVIGDEDLVAGHSSTDSGLYIARPKLDCNPIAYVPVEDGLIAYFDEDDDDPVMDVDESESQGRQVLDFLLWPRHVLTTANLPDARRISKGFITQETLIVGQEAVQAFFTIATEERSALSRNARQERAVAINAMKTLRENGYNL